MNKLDEIYLGVRSGDIGKTKFKREIKNYVSQLIKEDMQKLEPKDDQEMWAYQALELLDDKVRAL